MRCVTKATPIQFIDGNKLKSCRMGLTNHTRPISHHITPLVINGLGGGHTDTHILTHKQKQFQETRHARLMRIVASPVQHLGIMKVGWIE